ncbi:metal-dependent phosphohydrolase [Phycicoccus sp. MAQZ13P-2]|uniref:HD-GYP domain-containing protein n=1 Tax=Phycicoccus mangrovi TaxID=2840470 RepID=UPI001C002562|nr:HD domain-containing phosphohydrolase [Phycicoccus mangrovi]MBT9254136.1 metal-dependent phosphohydrolase [Phycicoccus mangrovi]MBT9272515.1 metal-dependent phosphohydrolase [Phycicoccus mangrovi]
MTPLFRRPGRMLTTLVLVTGALVVLSGILGSGWALPTLLSTHRDTFLVFVALVAAGELARTRMPSGRESAPLSAATAMAVVFVGPIAGEPPLDIPSGLVVLVVTTGLGLAVVVRRVRHHPAGVSALAARVVGVWAAAVLARDWGQPTLWAMQSEASVPRASVAVGMALVAAAGLVLESVLVAGIRSERQRTPWSAAVRDELGEVAPLTAAVVVTGPMVALMAPELGLLALPVALVPLAMAYAAVQQYARNRATNRQLIATLSHLTEHGGYTPVHHAERVAQVSVRIGRVLGLSERTLRDLEYAALLHDLGQISLLDPIPDGATVLAAPADQRSIALEGGRIIRRAEIFEDVADYVEGQTIPYRMVRELGEDVPMASRIIKCANAYDDLTGGSSDPALVDAAMERIHLGLGYEYDPDVVDALTRIVEDGAVGRVGERRAGAR